MHYSSLLQTETSVEVILARFDQDKILYRFEILEAISLNSFYANAAVMEWARQALEELELESLTHETWCIIAELAMRNANIIPAHFFESYAYLVACIQIDAIPPLMRLKALHPTTFPQHVERFRNSHRFISLEAWNAIKI